MAADKAGIVWRGETLARRAGRVLSEVCAPVVEVGSGVSGLGCVREDPAGSGPLAALVAGARALATPGPLVLLACDLPFVEPPVLRLLADWPGRATVIPMSGGRLQYACARYGADAVARSESALRYGEPALREAAGTVYDVVTESTWRLVAPPDAFADVDTPADLDRLGLS